MRKAVLILFNAIACMGAESTDFFVHLSDHCQVKIENLFRVEVVLDFDHNPADPPPGRIQGWCYGVCHDPELLAPLEVVTECPPELIDDGEGLLFWDGTIFEEPSMSPGNGVAIYALLDDTAPPDVLPAQNGWRDAAILYRVLTPPGGAQILHSQLALCDQPGWPVQEPAMRVDDTRIPAGGYDGGRVTACHHALFKRGDSNLDGRRNISDAIQLLSCLFSGDTTDCPCDDALDANDDGTVDIADAVRLLGYLFAGEAPLADPFALCGCDSTEDELGCDSFGICDSSPTFVPETVLAHGARGVAYRFPLTAFGGTPPYSWEAAFGSLPLGLSLHPSTGELSGVPTSEGSWTFVVQLSDAKTPPAMHRRRMMMVVLPGPIPPVPDRIETSPEGDRIYRLEVGSGEEFAVTVFENITTGYAWTLDYLDPLRLAFVDEWYEPVGDPVPGQGAYRHMRFRALASGSGPIVMTYARFRHTDYWLRITVMVEIDA